MKPPEKRNGNVSKQIKTNSKGNTDRVRFSYDDKRNSDVKSHKKNFDSSKPFSKYDYSNDKRGNYSDKKSDFGKFEINKKNSDGGLMNSRSDKSFGNFKAKHELKNGEYSTRNDLFKNKISDKRNQNNSNPSAIKSHGKSMDVPESKKSSNFNQINEKPPRFQKYQQHQQNDNNHLIQNWNEHNFNRISQCNDYQLQNSLANLTLQQNIANFQNQNSQDGFGEGLTGGR